MDNTKSVQLTADEVEALIEWNAGQIDPANATHNIDRMKYLDKRLKDFYEPEPPKEAKTSW